MQAIDIVEGVASDLTDPNYRVWSKANLTEYLNSALLVISEFRPDVSSDIVDITLTPGSTKHSLPAGSRRLIDIVRNMGSDGATPGKPIWAIDEATLNTYRPKWHSETGKTVIRNFIYDEKVPFTFYSYPPAHATTPVHVEAKVQKNPTLVTNVDTDAVSLDDVWETGIRFWMLYRAYSKETDSMESRSLADKYFVAFAQLIGVKDRVLRAFTPSTEIKKGAEK